MSPRRRVGLALAAMLVVVLWAAAPARACFRCSFSTVVGVSFGAYDALSGFPVDSSGSLTYRCDGVRRCDAILIELDRGAARSYQPRHMQHWGRPLEYNLYLDPARTTIWGNGAGGTGRYGPYKPPDKTNTTVTVYGRIPARQNVRAGVYADTIVVTIYL